MLRLLKCYHLHFTATLFAALALCGQSREASADSLPTTVYTASEQLLNYLPEKDDYPEELNGIVKDLREAIKNRQKPTSKKQFENVLKSADSLIQKLSRGNHDELFFLKALSYENLGDDENAAKFYHSSLELRADNSVALFRYAHLLLKKSDCTTALPLLYESAWRNQDDSSQINYVIGECLLLLGREIEATSAFELSSTSTTFFLPTYRRLLEIQTRKLESTKPPEERLLIENKIKSLLELITAKDPEDTNSAVRLAKILLQKDDPLLSSGNLTHAKDIAMQAVIHSDYKDPDAVRVLAQIQMKMKNYDSASSSIEKGLKNKPNNKLLLEAKQQLEIEKSLLVK